MDGSYEVVGVAENMVITSPYDKPRPMVYVTDNSMQNVEILRLNPKTSVQESIKLIEPLYKKVNPQHEFNYQFTDVAFAEKFGNEERVGTLASTLACLAIFISCLGIFGLSSFTAEQRTKEIGSEKSTRRFGIRSVEHDVERLCGIDNTLVYHSGADRLLHT
ncbi:MAG: hypothetical protein WDO15_19965 [Bacteroidota bacterium]